MPKSTLALVKQVIPYCRFFHPSGTRRPAILLLGKGKKVFCFQVHIPKLMPDIFRNAYSQ